MRGPHQANSVTACEKTLASLLRSNVSQEALAAEPLTDLNELVEFEFSDTGCVLQMTLKRALLYCSGTGRLIQTVEQEFERDAAVISFQATILTKGKQQS